MSAINIVILVDDKPNFIKTAMSTINDGEKYAAACRQILIKRYGANESGINQQSLIEGATGHIIHCMTKSKPVTQPEKWVADTLGSYSDYGLAKCGLTRAQYNKAL